MKALLIIHYQQTGELGNTVGTKMWLVPVSTHMPHGYKYSLVYIVANDRAIGYDNERGKGDHRHYEGEEGPYTFTGLRRLVDDFRKDMAAYKEKHHAG